MTDVQRIIDAINDTSYSFASLAVAWEKEIREALTLATEAEQLREDMAEMCHPVIVDKNLLNALRQAAVADNNEISALHIEIDDCHKRLNRWADAHNELIGEVELRKRIQELETFIESRGYDVP